MRLLNQAEIAQTAFRRLPPKLGECEALPYTGSDHNETCPYCKTDDTSVIVSKVARRPFADFYGSERFKVMECNFCTAVFSFGDLPTEQ